MQRNTNSHTQLNTLRGTLHTGEHTLSETIHTASHTLRGTLHPAKVRGTVTNMNPFTPRVEWEEKDQRSVPCPVYTLSESQRPDQLACYPTEWCLAR